MVLKEFGFDVDSLQRKWENNSHRPGGDKAVANGCLCNAKDNCHGSGYKFDNKGRAMYWVNDFCPLHGKYKIEK